MKKIQRLPANLVGRDFVCGDVHGSFSCVQKFLNEINFDANVDRLICAGDLIDRGPQNEKCLELLYEPWFFMTKGNHEELMEDHFFGGDLVGWWTPNGGAWGLQHVTNMSDESVFVRTVLKEKIVNLPHLITVEKPDGKVFHVLHAELDSVDVLTDADLADEQKLRSVSERYTRDGRVITWGRYIFARMYKMGLDERELKKIKHWTELERPHAHFGPDLGMIYSGHTPVRLPVQFYGQTNLDTMAYGSYLPDAKGWEGLTVAEPVTGKFWFVNDKEFKQVEPVIFK